MCLVCMDGWVEGEIICWLRQAGALCDQRKISLQHCTTSRCPPNALLSVLTASCAHSPLMLPSLPGALLTAHHPLFPPRLPSPAGKPGVRLTLADLQSQFGVGLKEAAARLGICPTTLKRACRWAVGCWAAAGGGAAARCPCMSWGCGQRSCSSPAAVLVLQQC